MGADMLITGLAIEVDREPDFAKGREHIRDNFETLELTDDDLLDLERYRDADGEIGPTELLHLVDELEEALGGRYVATIEVRGLHLYLTGGLSWGDDTDEAGLMRAAEAIPGLIAAIGFKETWD